MPKARPLRIWSMGRRLIAWYRAMAGGLPDLNQRRQHCGAVSGGLTRSVWGHVDRYAKRIPSSTNPTMSHALHLTPLFRLARKAI